jgi:hypothetical protein
MRCTCGTAAEPGLFAPRQGAACRRCDYCNPLQLVKRAKPLQPAGGAASAQTGALARTLLDLGVESEYQQEVVMYKSIVAAGASLAFAAAPAFGQGDDNSDGLYLGAGLGDFSTEIDDIDDVDDVDLDFDSDESASKYFAGWRFNRFLAVQLDNYDFGDSNLALNLLDVTAETEGWAPSIVGTLPIGPIELFARAGRIYYDLTVRLGDENVIDESGDDAVYSAGIGFTLFERLNLKAEYEVIDISEYDDANAAWISATWRF